MLKGDIARLAKEIGAALELDDALREGAIDAISGATGDAKLAPADLDSTDKVLALIYKIKPGWAVSMTGTAHLPDGHWSCTLRQSSFRDDDEYLGIGRGPTLAHALLAALLQVVSLEA